jgi:hypothetical protein
MASIEKEKWVTNVATEIGLGPTLFIMTQKVMCHLFCVLAIINVPLFLFYLRGNGVNDTNDNQKTHVDINMVTIFGFFSLGNLGTSKHVCSSVNVGNYEKHFDLTCKYGSMKELSSYGI